MPSRHRHHCSALTLLAATAACAHPRSQPPGASTQPRTLGFFVAPSDTGGSADLGGLAGADRRCQALAAQVGAGFRIWRAYLSAGDQDGQVVHARDRIGEGPWFNATGELIARDLDELHDDRNRIDRHRALDVHGRRDPTGPHDILTGSDRTGHLAYYDGRPATCGDWRHAGDGVATIGHDDRMEAHPAGSARFPRWFGSWNADHATLGCSAEQLSQSGGGGGIYCFAADHDDRPVPEPVVPERDDASFRRGVNLNHWIGDNLPDALYGAPWFDREDVTWIADQGFDHIRVWVNGGVWLGEDGEFDEAALAPFDALLAWARERRLGVVLAMYGLPGHRASVRGVAAADEASPFTDAATRRDAAYLWWAVAARYRHVGPRLRFDLLVAPEAEHALELQRFHAEALAAIRRVDRERLVILAPRQGRLADADDVLLGDPNTILGVEFVEPEVFTIQLGLPEQPRIAFPATIPDLRARAQTLLSPDWVAYSNTRWTTESVAALIEQQVDDARLDHWRHAIYVGRIGVMRGADDDSARTYLATVRSAFEARGVGWAVYDYHTGGAVRGDDGRGAPTRVVAALLGGAPHG